ncbi:MAG: hypothetical protein B1H03_07005 [Planctomycetales bacterium 4484_113]|nr:MAG: hypothetical protein B1H03_07005 [Planctomycetales bacterium 4484_113]
MDDMDEFELGETQEKKRHRAKVVDKRFDREEIMREETPEEKAAREKREAEAAKDRREAKPAATPETGTRAGFDTAAREEPAADQEEARREVASLFDLGIDGFLKQNLGIYLNFAYIYMGLMANPANGLVTQDLGKAKLAIDAFEFAVGKLKGQFKPQEDAELQRLLKDLKLNFMNAASTPAQKQPPNEKPG